MEIKIPFYHILNMFLTGLVFAGGYAVIYPEYALAIFENEIIKNIGTGPEIVVTVCAFAAAYEVGLIINRAGSVIVEDFLRWRKWIPFNDDYVLYNEKKKQYPIMNTLSREYAVSRTGITLFLTLLVFAIVAKKYHIAIACAVITVVYFRSCRKHAEKIVKLVEGREVSEKKSGESK